jgi:hypothetical protein
MFLIFADSQIFSLSSFATIVFSQTPKSPRRLTVGFVVDLGVERVAARWCKLTEKCDDFARCSPLRVVQRVS